MGDCPGFLREAFLHWALDGAPDAVTVDGPFGLAEWPWDELCRCLRQCTDPMPVDLCRSLGVPHGTTYGTTARRLLREAGSSGLAVLRGVDAEGFTRGWTGSQWVRLDDTVIGCVWLLGLVLVTALCVAAAAGDRQSASASAPRRRRDERTAAQSEGRRAACQRVGS